MADNNSSCDAVVSPSTDASLALSRTTSAGALIGRGYYPALTASSMTLWALLLGPVLSTLPAQVSVIAPGNKVAALALVTGLGGVIGIITNPVVGHLSDITRTPLGRRIPWIIGGVLVIVPSAFALGWANSIAALTLWWSVLLIGASMVMAPTSATIPDVVPQQRRGLLLHVLVSLARLHRCWEPVFRRSRSHLD